MKNIILVILCMQFWVASTQAQEKPTIVFSTFKTAPEVSWPYDMKELQRQVVAELQNKDRKKYNISTRQAPSFGTHYLVLEVEVLEWHPGNAAKRALVGVGTGRESRQNSLLSSHRRRQESLLNMKTPFGRNSMPVPTLGRLDSWPTLWRTKSAGVWLMQSWNSEPTIGWC